MTKGAKHKAKIRERAARNDESYSTARAQLGGGNAGSNGLREVVCDICNKPIVDRNGWIVAGEFDRQARRLLAGETRTELEQAFCVAVANAYANQFTRFDEKEPTTGISTESLGEKIARMYSREERIAALRRADDRELYAFMFVHFACLPEAQFHTDYDIELARVRTHAKAIEWTQHLHTKPWWDGRAWAVVLSRLFERRAA